MTSSTSNGDSNVVVQLLSTPEELARRLKVEVERLARLPVVEWMFYLDDVAKKHGIEPATEENDRGHRRSR
jgi:hypothetical protein